ncbi:unnamed protein product [Lymnaea stagnalis]|uniref:Uncharacterized protein n=1 Tax=Lymnaea stagnalis TaxID=6523 RepID=A0AAV2HJ14_LYMST
MTTESTEPDALHGSAPLLEDFPPRVPSSNYETIPFDFHTKTSFDADDALIQTRSKQYKAQPSEKDDDIWKRQPPDFRYVVYDPHPPKRNTVDAIRPWEYGTVPGQKEVIRRNRDDDKLPDIFDHKEPEAKFHTMFRTARPFTAKKMFVSSGMNKPGTYLNPKPHDFRQYPPIKSLGLDEFVTNHEKDPYALRFKSQHLNIISGLPREPPKRDLAPGRQMDKPMSGKKKWDAQLILDKDSWPKRSAAFTRHRRRHRQPYSAFMERVETALTTRWSMEQMDKALQACS